MVELLGNVALHLARKPEDVVDLVHGLATRRLRTILFLDYIKLYRGFYKAFDILERLFILSAYKCTGLVGIFVRLFSYFTQTNSSVVLPTGASPRFDIKSETRPSRLAFVVYSGCRDVGAPY